MINMEQQTLEAAEKRKTHTDDDHMIRYDDGGLKKQINEQKYKKI